MNPLAPFSLLGDRPQGSSLSRSVAMEADSFLPSAKWHGAFKQTWVPILAVWSWANRLTFLSFPFVYFAFHGCGNVQMKEWV